jgi:hypothetical protein
MVGAVIVLFGIKAYQDASEVLNASGSLMSKNYIVLSKPVSSLNTIAGVLGAKAQSFSSQEISDMMQVEGVSRIAPFRTAAFPVYGSATIEGLTVSTEMFLESVPDDFIDIDTDNWTASIEDEEIPIVIPRTYLNFYNYGFATARGMPQIGESLVSALPIKLIVRGAMGRVEYQGRVTGFTDHLNSILVPDDFMAEANAAYAPGEEDNVSRIIVQTDGSSTDALMDYISNKKYVVDGNGDESMRLLYIVRTIISVVVAVGLLVSALAFFLLLVSILLMVEKNRYKNEVLHQLGYPHAKIALPYQLLAGVVDLFVWLIAMVIVGMVYPLAIPILQLVNPNFEGSDFWPVGLSSVGLCLVFILIHYLLIRRRIRKI